MIGLSYDDVYKDLLERREIEIYNLSDLNSELRFEAENFQKKYYHLFDLLSKKKCEKLGSLVSDEIKTGHTPSMKNQSFYGGNYHFIKTDNLRTNEIRDTFTDFLSEKGYATLKRVHLESGDIIVTVIGATYDIIARCALISDEILPATINQNIALVRPDKNKIVPEYLVSYMNSKYGRMCLEYLARQMEQVNLNCQEIGQFIVPILSTDFQKKIQLVIQRAYRLLSDSKIQYKKVESNLVSELGFDMLKPSKEQISIRSFSDINIIGRIDAEYYQPKYDDFQNHILNYKNGYTTPRQQFKQIKTRCKRDLTQYPYVEIGDVNVATGESIYNYVATKDLPDNAKIITQKGDLVVSTVRPYRGAVSILSQDNLLVSGAFTVLREKGGYPAQTLQVLFRTALYKEWLLKYNVGTSYPVIKDDDVLDIPIPNFDDAIHTEISEKVRDSEELLKESHRLLECAKKAVEMAIEQDEAKAIEYLESVK